MKGKKTRKRRKMKEGFRNYRGRNKIYWLKMKEGLSKKRGRNHQIQEEKGEKSIERDTRGRKWEIKK